MLGIDARAAKITWTVFLIGLAIFIAYAIRDTLVVLVLAIFFAYVLLPLEKLLATATLHRLPRAVVLTLLVVLLLLAVIAFSIFVGNRIADEAAGLATQLPQLLDPQRVLRQVPLPSFLDAQRDRILAYVVDQLRFAAEHIGPVAQRLGLGLWHSVGGVVDVVLVPLLGFFLAKDAPRIGASVHRLLRRSHNDGWADLLPQLNEMLAHYVRALALLSLITFACYGAALGLLGVPYAALLAGAAAILEATPVVGPLVASIAIVMVCLLTGYPHLLWVVAFIAIYRGVQDYVLAPHLIGKEVELSSLTVIVGLLAGEQLGGIVGMFLAVPALAAARLIFTERAGRADSAT